MQGLWKCDRVECPADVPDGSAFYVLGFRLCEGCAMVGVSFALQERGVSLDLMETASRLFGGDEPGVVSVFVPSERFVVQIADVPDDVDAEEVGELVRGLLAVCDPDGREELPPGSGWLLHRFSGAVEFVAVPL